MLRKKWIMFMVLMLLIIGTVTAAASVVVYQKGVLGGKVSNAGLVRPGIVVHEGDVLVQVDTLTGPAPAARATVDGVVTEVLVQPGQTIAVGDVVARIQVSK